MMNLLSQNPGSCRHFSGLYLLTVGFILFWSKIYCTESECPDGFILNKEANKCYRLINEKDVYDEQVHQCSQLNTGAHLAAIKNQEEDAFIQNLIAKEEDKSNCVAYWATGGLLHGYYIAGRRPDDLGCDAELKWELSEGKQEEITYTNYFPDEPNCMGGDENCLHLGPQYLWNDAPCDERWCAVCEYRL